MRKIFSGAITVAVLAIFLFLLFVALTRAQQAEVIAAGGTFTLEKAAVANGGNQKQLAPFDEHGTTGQAAAGSTSSGGRYSIYSGFWTPDEFAPTAAGVLVGGRITNASGVGIGNVLITISSTTNESRSALSSSLGYYMFTDVEAGETYTVTVTAKRFTFDDPVRVTHVLDDLTNLDFVAIPIE